MITCHKIYWGVSTSACLKYLLLALKSSLHVEYADQTIFLNAVEQNKINAEYYTNYSNDFIDLYSHIEWNISVMTTWEFSSLPTEAKDVLQWIKPDNTGNKYLSCDLDHHLTYNIADWGHTFDRLYNRCLLKFYVLINKYCEVSRLKNWVFKISNHYEVKQTPRQQYCRNTCQFQRYRTDLKTFHCSFCTCLDLFVRHRSVNCWPENRRIITYCRNG